MEIKWPENYSPGNRPLNLDNSIHSCKRDTTPAKKPSTSSTGITENALTAATVLSEIEAFRIKFGPIESDARFDAPARIYISRMMKR